MPTPIFKERLSPSKSIIAALALSGPMVLLAAVPFGWPIALVLALAVPIALILAAFYLSPTTTVDDSLRSGRFHIPLSVVLSAQHFTGEDARLERGPRLDARAKLAIRGDIDAVVKVELNDPLDPTPYVLVSSRKPRDLVAALSANRP